MNRDQLIRVLRRYARKQRLPFAVNTTKGAGSHYRPKLGAEITTVQRTSTRAVSSGS